MSLQAAKAMQHIKGFHTLEQKLIDKYVEVLEARLSLEKLRFFNSYIFEVDAEAISNQILSYL